ncbi:lipopolysaccharide assembly protein LapA domain-containing protein [Tundrisphaera lichenicola]|uniref:lipopolysaccharide assembly protein LapA domain-containing protein n=1 Tax=Tundrisphaera lichenicola TaxID=2029860 RepID=UPI003EBC58C4
MASSHYKRRKRSMVRNLWVYRRLVAVAIVLGLMLWFVLTNNEQVNIAFPFGLGTFQSTTGLVILLSSLVGSLVTALTMTLIWAIRRGRADRDDLPADPPGKSPILDELPPPDYAAKTGDGIARDAPWT